MAFGQTAEGSRTLIFEGATGDESSGTFTCWRAKAETLRRRGRRRIVLVDDSLRRCREDSGALKNLGITDKPVRFVINTHYHGDHTAGTRRLQTRVHGDCADNAEAVGDRRDRGNGSQ